MTVGGFRDQSHIERIRERLWSGREMGRAAVMVGAGFSRNAERGGPSVPVFPLWGDIAETMYDALYPAESLGETDREADRKARIAGTGAMRLASEYEMTFGRQALDDLLIRAIPDERYESGRIHETLLSLPWSDVFTTNYDTLLERTRESVHERKYNLIFATSDIPTGSRPRIVKLHGSLPSYRPFIVTEEDFRTYPTENASFVNLVQQSVMENAFCLLGFSGDDPNFLSWTGWVRDNLGPTAPPIYLVGLLEVTDSQRRLLEEGRKVTPVDLSPLFPRAEWPDPLQRHARATEWFLENLVEGRPPRLDRWPAPSILAPRERSEGLPKIPEGPRPIPDPGPRMPQPLQSFTTEELENLLEKWSESRRSYPGWQIAPASNRESLWIRTEHWIQPVLNAVNDLEVPKNLFLLHELNWRLERCFMPLFSDWDLSISEVLETYNPFPGLIDVPAATVRPDSDEHQSRDWDNIAGCWVELAFALARSAREEQDEGRFRRWMDRLKNLVGRSDEWRARWHYEECLFHLFRLDQTGVRATLRGWPGAPGLPLWEIRRAAVLVELSDMAEAERVTERALQTVRSRMHPYEDDRALMSQEALALTLLEGIKANDLGLKKGVIAGYRDRLRELDRYGCNPMVEIERLKGTVVGAPPDMRGWRQETVPAFDPGRQNTNTSMPGGLNISPVLPAFALLRMTEEGALPSRVGMYDRFSETLLTAARWIEPHAPLWSFSAASRHAKEKELLRLWDRPYVAALPQEMVEHLFALLHNSLVQSIEHLIANPSEPGLGGWNFARRQARISSELISRVSIRCSDAQREELFDLAKRMHELPLFRERHWLHDCPHALFRRLLSHGMSRTQILRRVPELLSLPVSGEAGFEVSNPGNWVDPTELIRWDYDQPPEDYLDQSSWEVPIDNLIRMVRSGTFEARRRAALRLSWLFDIGSLGDQQIEAFGDALWSRVDERTGLPSETSFLPRAFLSLPEPEPGRTKDAFHRWVLGLDFVKSVQRQEAADGSVTQTVTSSPGEEGLPEHVIGATVPLTPRSPEDERTFIDWSLDESVGFLRKIVGLWDDEKQALSSRLSGEPVDLFDGIGQLIEGRLRLMSEVILPRMVEANDGDKASAERLIGEIEYAGAPVSLALPTLLYVKPDLLEDVTRKISADITSGDQRRARSAAHGVYLWIEHSRQGGITAPPDQILDKLINRSISRNPAALGSVLSCLRDLLHYHPEAFNERQLDAVGASLEDLLEDTCLPEPGNWNREGQSSAPLPVGWRPDYRWRSAQLAYRLCQAYTGREGVAPPEVLRRWEIACREDPLPEVRTAWKV